MTLEDYEVFTLFKTACGCERIQKKDHQGIRKIIVPIWPNVTKGITDFRSIKERIFDYHKEHINEAEKKIFVEYRERVE